MSKNIPITENSPAARVIAKCGGAKRVKELTGVSENWIYRWTWPNGGTGGRVPYKSQIRLLEAAREGLVDIKPDDFLPDELRGGQQP